MRSEAKAPGAVGAVVRVLGGSSEWVLELFLVAAAFAAVGAVIGD